MRSALRKKYRLVFFAIVLGLLLGLAIAAPAQAVTPTHDVTLKLVDSGGSPLGGGTGRYGPGANYGSAFWPGGATDATTGETAAVTLTEGTYSFEMKYNNTTDVKVSVLVDRNMTFEFQTGEVTIRLEDSDGSGLDGGVVAYGIGASTGSWVWPGGTTGSDGSGETSAEIFDGTYGFRMEYQATKEYKQNVPVTDGAVVTFYTTNVTLQYSGSLAYGGGDGGSRYFSKPSMELLSDGGGSGTPVQFQLRSTGGAAGRLGLVWPAATGPGATFTRSLIALRLTDSAGNPLNGGTARYQVSWWAYAPGYTGNEAAAPGILAYAIPGLVTTVTNEMTYNNTKQTVTQDASANSVYQFQTNLLTLRLETCDHTPLDGGKPRWGNGSTYTTWWFPVNPGTETGNTAPGETSAEVFPGTYSFEMMYQATAEAKQNVVVPDADYTITWQTTDVTLYYSGSISYGGGSGDSRWFNKPSMELLPGTYKFHFRGGGRTDLTIGGCSMSKVVNVLVLTDHNGAPLAGGTGRGGYGASYWTWHVAGSTDANGVLFDIRDRATQPTDMSYEMKFNNTTEHKTQDVSAESVFEFDTNLLTLRLETCGGNPLDGGRARYGIGSSYWTWWFPGGVTGSSADGETAAEVFPGTYSFEMMYQATAEAKQNVVVPDADYTITWQTTDVTLYYSGSISYGGGSGDSRWFNKPSMELLPGTYKFHFRGGGRTDLTIGGCSMSKVVNVLVLTDHNGAPLAGGTGRGGFGTTYNTWHVSPPPTDANGVLLDIHNASSQPTDMSYEMKYNNTTEVKTQDVSANSVFEFDTNLVTLRLETCGGTPLDGGNPRGGSGTTYTTWWFPGGATGSSAPGETAAEFFPGTYSFEMQYKGGGQVKSEEVIPDADHTLIWQTTAVTLNYSGSISYGGPTGDSAWFTQPSMEMLPDTYRFHFRGGDVVDFAISGCSFEKTVAALTVVESDGVTGVPGVSFVWQIHGSPPDQPVPGMTNASGVLLHVMDGYNNSLTRYIPTYLGGMGPRMDPRPATESFVNWQLINVTVELTDVSNTPIAGANPLVTYEYGGHGLGRWEFGNLVDGQASLEMMPTSGYVAFFVDNYNDTKARVDASPMNVGPYTVTFQCGRIVDGNYSGPPYYLNHWRIYGGPNVFPTAYPYTVDVLTDTNFYFYPTAGESPRQGPIAINPGQTLEFTDSSGTYTITP